MQQERFEDEKMEQKRKDVKKTIRMLHFSMWVVSADITMVARSKHAMVVATRRRESLDTTLPEQKSDRERHVQGAWRRKQEEGSVQLGDPDS
jgi:hypothetical protein